MKREVNIPGLVAILAVWVIYPLCTASSCRHAKGGPQTKEDVAVHMSAASMSDDEDEGIMGFVSPDSDDEAALNTMWNVHSLANPARNQKPPPPVRPKTPKHGGAPAAPPPH